MKIFLAGATGVLGRRLTPLLVAQGHIVVGMTRSAERCALLSDLGAQAVVCDVFDAGALRTAIVAAAPDVVMHQLTDLPDDVTEIGRFAAANARIRREGTQNLLSAAVAANVHQFFAQSVAWQLVGDSGKAVTDMETMVLASRGVVLRYGQFYGPGTYHPVAQPPSPSIHIDDAATRTCAALDATSGILAITD